MQCDVLPLRPAGDAPGTSLDEDQAALRIAAASGAALCTIVGIDGSFSRRLGAQLAIAPDGTTTGSLADGCLERELTTQAQAEGGGPPRVLRYGRGSPFIDFRLPCGSGLDILVDPVPDREALRDAVARLDRREEAMLALPVERQGLLASRRFIPSARLLVLGTGPEAAELAWLGSGYGLSIEQAGPSAGLSLGQAPAGLQADPWTAIVLLFHDHEWEGALIEWALATPAFYIGALGGAATRENRRAMLAASGFAQSEIDRVRSPIGLIPHARDARTLALSVLADVIAHYERLRP